MDIPVYVKLNNARDGSDVQDVTVSGQEIAVVKSNNERVGINAAGVIDPDALEEDFFDQTLSDVLVYAVNGMNGCVLVLGASDSGKTEFLHSSNMGSGIVYHAVSALFERLNNPPPNITLDYKVTTSFVELYGERTTDLLHLSNKAFPIEQDPVLGPTFLRATQQSASSKSDLLRYYNMGLGARSQEHTAEGPVQQDAINVFTVRLQITKDDSETKARMTTLSHVTFIEGPGTERLLQPEGELWGSLGDRVPKAIISLKNLGEDLLAGKDVATARYDTSLETQLLGDALGGNTITTVFATLRHGQPDRSSATLNIARNLASVKNYPVSLSDAVQGLVARFRRKIAALEEELKVSRNESGQAGEIRSEAESLRNLVHELRGDVLQLKEEKGSAEMQTDKLAIVLANYKTRFQDLLEARNKLNVEMIESEEKRLAVSEKLLEVQIEMKRMEEKFEQERFELESRIQSFESETANDVAKRENEKQEVGSLREELKKSKESEKALRQEFLAVRTDLQDTKTDLRRATENNDDLNAELLTLGNRAQHFEAQCNALQDELKVLRGESETAGTEVHELRRRAEEAEREAERVKQDEQELANAKMKAELELERVTVDYETKRLDLQREVDSLRRAQEEDQMNRRQGVDERDRELQSAREELTKQTQSLRAELGVTKRRLEDANRQVVELRRESDRLTAEAEEQRKLREEDAERYRERLQRLLADEDKTAVGAGDAADERLQAVHARIQELRNELVSTYESREKELSERLSSLERENVSVAQQNRAVHDRLQELRDQLEDAGVEGISVPSRKEVAQLRVDATDTEVRLTRELEKAREENRTLHMHLQSAKDSALSAAEQHRRMYQEAQEKLSRAQTEAQLAVQRNEEQKTVIEQLRSGGAGGGLDETTTKQLQDMQEKLLSQLKDMRSANEAATNRMETRRSRHEDAAASEELMEARAHVKSLERLLEDARGDVERKKAENAKLKERLDAGEGGGGGGGGGDTAGLAKALKESQRKVAELETKVQTLDQEKKRYLRTIRTLKNQVKGLNEELNELRAA